MPTSTFTRREWLAASFTTMIALESAAGQEKPRREGKERPPITGEARPGLDRFDAVLLEMLHKHGVPGGSLCLAKDGRLVLARGYGWANVKAREPVRPEMLFGIGSVSKAVTAVAVLKLVETGKLRLQDHAFDVLKDLHPLPGQKEDPRVRTITIRQFLNHTSGYESMPHKPEAAQAFGVKQENLTADQIIRYRLGKPLAYAPGTEAQYSNYGYLVLGQIIEHASGEPYADYVDRHVLRPMGIRHAACNVTLATYPADWVHRYNRNGEELPPLKPLQGAAGGGWLTSAVELARFMTAVDGTRGSAFLPPRLMREMLAAPPPPVKPRKNGSHFGLGWDTVRFTPKGPTYTKNGGLPGYRAYVGHTPENVDWAVLLNGGTGEEAENEVADAANHLQREIERVERWPKGNLFGRF
ncbi:MAG TPA: serine hydrolase domain-containing protein [Gemmataceae bacterium]|nr:serine hydrolase domain-containing protein [Gemmataceae bacterium]